MFGPFQLATSSRTRCVSAATSERAPPMTPAIEVGPSRVLDQDHLAVQRPGLPVERLDLLALARAADGQARARDPVEVEGVQRLAGQQHHVVGDVHDVVDRPLPGGRQPRLQPQRRRADRDVLEHARGEARAQLGAARRSISTPAGSPGAAGILGPGRRRQRRAGGGVQLAGDAVDAEAVGAVGRHLELEHVGRDRQHVVQRRARRELGVERQLVEHHDARRGRRADLELVLGQDHPFRGDAAQLGRLQLRRRRASPRRAARRRPSGRPRRWGRRRRSSRARSSPSVDGADLRRSASGCCSALSTRPTTKFSDGWARRRGGSPRPWCRSSSGAPRSPSTSSGGSQYSRSQWQRNPHPNCSRKRRSLSSSRRRSGMPCLSIAIRSTPRPQAKPWTFSGS